MHDTGALAIYFVLAILAFTQINSCQQLDQIADNTREVASAVRSLKP